MTKTKIAIIGSHNSGKTTSLYFSLYRLKKNKESIGVGHEVARQCPYPVGDKATVITQLWILFKQIEQEARLQEYYDKIILDRSVFDSIAYSLRLPAREFKFIFDTAMSWAKTSPYKTLIYLTPLPLEEDPARGENLLEFQKEITNSFKKMLRHVPRDTEVITIEYKPKEERCLEVYRAIRDRLK